MQRELNAAHTGGGSTGIISRQQLVEHNSQREDIGAGIRLFFQKHFGRHIAASAGKGVA